MNWRVKGVVQKVLAAAPGGLWFTEQLKRAVGKARRFDGEIDAKLSDFQIMLEELRPLSIAVRGARVFEIGSGWYPTFPVCLHLVGAARVTTVDLVRHMQPDLLSRLVGLLAGKLDWLAEISGEPREAIASRRQQLEDGLRRGLGIGEASGGGIDYRAPADAARMDLPPQSVDLVFSNSVLEHIPLVVLDAIFAESWRLLAPGGHIFHSVNCGDHYAYTDGTIGQLNYLQFSAREWELLWNNDFQYQNRLRAVDFLDLARKHDFELRFDNAVEHATKLGELQALPRIAHEFNGYTPEELCVTSVDFIGRKKPA